MEMCGFDVDVVLIAENQTKLEDNLKIWNEKALKYGLEVNMEKTKIIVISKRNNESK